MTLETSKPTRENPAPSGSRRYPAWVVYGFFLAVTILGRFLIWLACRLSRERAIRLTMWLTRRLEPLTRERRHGNLRAFFANGSRTEEQLAALDAEHLQYLARLRAEIARTFEGTPEQLKAVVHLEGLEHLQTVLAAKRGVMVVSGHSATYWFLPAIMAVHRQRVTALFTQIKFRPLENLLLKFAERYHIRVAFVGRDASLAIRNAIRRNEVVYLSFDVSMHARRKERFPFGAASVEIDPSPALLAVRSGMPTLQAACVQIENGRSRITFYPPDADELAPPNRNAVEICRLWTRRLEAEVKQHPAQWWPWGYMKLLPPVENSPKPE
jgi:KDO2-lipid IV(A) lauroyltransferase